MCYMYKVDCSLAHDTGPIKTRKDGCSLFELYKFKYIWKTYKLECEVNVSEKHIFVLLSTNICMTK